MVLLFNFPAPAIFAQVAGKMVTTQAIITILDKHLLLEDGITYAEMTRYAEGRTSRWHLRFYNRETGRLVVIEKEEYRPGHKILYLLRGNECHVYHNGLVQVKSGRLRLEKILNSEFSWEDISGSLFEANYSPVFMAAKEINGIQYRRTALLPASDQGYQKLVLLTHPDNHLPYRIEYYNNQLIEKILEFTTGNLTVKTPTGSAKQERLIALKMTDLDSGNRTEIKFTRIDTGKNLPASMYTTANLDR